MPKIGFLAQMLSMDLQMRPLRNFAKPVTVSLLAIRSNMTRILVEEISIRGMTLQSNHCRKNAKLTVPCLYSFSLNFRDNFSNVVIFYDDHLINTLHRSEVLSFAGFLSMCGGLFGLFLGIFALSIMRRKYEMILPLQQTDINTEVSTSKH